ncbi:glycosyltransferase family 2 protein [Celeribacter marinus]|uniref:Putative glycosyl transferase n=1 Tax=Celeribacter marinus TaxID=1397108 RepID=A0A0N9ZKI2_9RHOB|nr:glycosyltransferase family 2 protein [Celeribacter marinus]ALI56207.1 putative glycosyl transferase [Celeribacter marinus]SFK85182.1 Glycosyl transferase family 2 [Celeribacter marinus]
MDASLNPSLLGPSVSIIIPFYDETAFLHAALASVKAQRIDDIEIIVINDNPEVFDARDLERLTDGFDVTVVHHTQNSGLSAARNSGLAIARGTYIGFLDADDYYTTRGLEHQLAYAMQTRADIVHACCYLGRAGSVETQILPRDQQLHMTQRVTRGLRGGEEAQFIVSSWSSLYSRAFLDEFDLTFDTEQRKFEDRLFVLACVTRAGSIAYLGAPVRVWRRRAGSISTTSEGIDTHTLQVQLIEKCMALVRARVAERTLPKRYEKRELFNTVSRLIWDMDIIDALADPHADEAYVALGARVATLLGEDSFGNSVFDDAMVRRTSRVGMRTKRGHIRRVDFFELHSALRTGNFSEAHQILARRAPPSAPPMPVAPKFAAKRLVIHIGQHKTGSTYLQHQLIAHHATLKTHGILVPKTGLVTDDHDDMRQGAMPGHQGLLAALRSGDERIWDALWDEIRSAKTHTVFISCENMSMPTAYERTAMIDALMHRFSGFGTVDVVAFQRDPTRYAESFYREWVAGGRAMGARSYAEFLVDFGTALCDLPAQLAPFEAATGRAVQLGDFDAARNGGGIWPAFCALAGLPIDPVTECPAQAAPRYTSFSRESTDFLRLVNMLQGDIHTRKRTLRGYFATAPDGDPTLSAIAPEARLAVLNQWIDLSASFAAARGYSPDTQAWRTALTQEAWTPPAGVSQAQLEALLAASASALPSIPTPIDPVPVRTEIPRATAKRRRYRIRPRPWVYNVLDWIKQRRPFGDRSL